MIASLPLFHRVAGRPVIVLGEGEAAAAKRRLVERAGGVVCGEAEAEARLAFVALDRPEEAAARLKARGVLVNVPDRPDLCDFTVPSLLDRSPVLIAIGTGGASAGLAKGLRLRLERLLPASLGTLAGALVELRGQLVSHWSTSQERRLALDSALAEGGPLDPLVEHGPGDVAAWLSGIPEELSEKAVEIILTSDDFEDLTLRQLRLLGSADLIAYEPGVPLAILDRARADAVRLGIAPGTTADGSGLVVTLRKAAITKF